ncbi:MAG: 3'(2'),5'-bisphosphate nucleotidase CysQ [Prolixibacteraceae bacterium]
MNSNLKLSIIAALAAGDEILKIYHTTDFEIEFKSDQSPLTKADKAAHETLCTHLRKTPYPILSEEGTPIAYAERANWKTFWLLDPLDGTKEFIKRNGEFTVNIALIDQQTPVLGVVFLPVTGELYFADRQGSFKTKKTTDFEEMLKNALPLPIAKARKEFIVLASRSHMNQDTKDYIQQLKLQGKSTQLITKGSSLKLCLVAEGKADCYPRLGPTMEWDIAAGHAIVKFANKTVNSYPENVPLLYNKENLLNPWFIVE